MCSLDLNSALNNITRESLLNLGDQKGKLSLTRDGKLAVLEGSTKRDGKVLRFFKGIGDAEYRRTDHMKKTAGDPEIAGKIMKKAVAAFADRPEATAGEKDTNATVRQILQKSLDKGQPLTPELISKAETFAATLSQALPGLVDASLAKGVVTVDGEKKPLLDVLSEQGGKTPAENKAAITDMLRREIAAIMTTDPDSPGLLLPRETITGIRAELDGVTPGRLAGLPKTGALIAGQAESICVSLAALAQGRLTGGVSPKVAAETAQAALDEYTRGDIALVGGNTRSLTDIHTGKSLGVENLAETFQTLDDAAKAKTSALLRPGLERLTKLPDPPGKAVTDLLKMAEHSPHAATNLLNRLADACEAARTDSKSKAPAAKRDALETIIAKAGKDPYLADAKIPGRGPAPGPEGAQLSGIPLEGDLMRGWGEGLMAREPEKFSIEDGKLSAKCGIRELLTMALGVKDANASVTQKLEDALFIKGHHQYGMGRDIIAWESAETKHGMDVRQNTRIDMLLEGMLELDGFDYQPFDATLEKVNAELFKGADQEAVVLDDLLQRDDINGLVFGERHGTPITQNFIRDHLDQLKEGGVTTLYVEHLHSYMAADIAHFNETGEIRPGSAFENTLNNRDNSNLKILLAEAHKKGLDLGFMDNNEYTRSEQRTLGMEYRDLLMNKVAVDTIRKTHPPKDGGKFVILVGEAHAQSHPGLVKDGIPGLDQRLSAPLILVKEDGKVGLSMDIPGNRRKDV